MFGLLKSECTPEALNAILAAAQANPPPDLPLVVRGHLSSILEGKNKGILTVLVTLLFKKTMSPLQDIRMHRKEHDGGFSGRVLDTRVVTPFMKENGFPAMSESGWLTRSLEQPAPYDMNFPGRFKPKALKPAFLGVIHEVQAGNASARDCLAFLFLGLIKKRTIAADFKFHTTEGFTVSQVIACLSAHFSMGGSGVSRLPTLAIHAIYQQLVEEVKRYDGCKLAPLEHHQSPDDKTGMLGDVQVYGKSRDAMEVVEIKHNIPLTLGIVRTCRDKFRHVPLQRFYLLSTGDVIGEREIQAEIADILDKHGCQMIVNGIVPSLKYYLRLLAGPEKFVRAYEAHLQSDGGVSQDIREEWNKLVKIHLAPLGEEE